MPTAHAHAHSRSSPATPLPLTFRPTAASPDSLLPSARHIREPLRLSWHPGPAISLSTLPFYSHCPWTPAASSLGNYNSILTNHLLVPPPAIHCCHSNLPKTPLNHAKPLIKNLHYLFITTRMKSKRLSFFPHSGLNPRFQLTAHHFPVSTDSTKAGPVTPLIHLETFLQVC